MWIKLIPIFFIIFFFLRCTDNYAGQNGGAIYSGDQVTMILADTTLVSNNKGKNLFVDKQLELFFVKSQFQISFLAVNTNK
jgi:predicted outer membrane repeat protein